MENISLLENRNNNDKNNPHMFTSSFQKFFSEP